MLRHAFRLQPVIISIPLLLKIAFAFWFLALGFSLRIDASESDDNAKKSLELTFKARSLIKEGDPEKALPLLRKAIELNPSSITAHTKLSDALFLTQDFTAAIHECGFVIASLKTGPWTNAALYRRGCCYAGLKKYDLALKDLNEMIKREPQSARTHFAKAEILRVQGNFQAALTEYHLSLTGERFDKTPVAIYFLCAECDRKLSDRRAERTDLSNLLKLGQNLDAHCLRGDSFMKDKQFKEASEDYEDVLALDPTNTRCKELLAVCQKELGH